MKTNPTLKARLGLAAGYVGLILLAVGVLGVLYRGKGDSILLAAFWKVAIWLHALPLLLTKFYQDLRFGGPDPNAGGALVFLAVVAVLWWPLPVLSASPRLWKRAAFGRVTVGYLVAVLVLSIGAVAWLTVDPSLLAS